MIPSRTLLLIALAACLTLGAVSGPAAETKRVPAGSFIYVNGKITVQRADAPSAVPAKRGDVVFFGDTIRSGAQSSASIVYRGGCVAAIGSGTEITIPAPGETKGGAAKTLDALHMALGKLWMKVNKRDNPFEVRTASAVAAVKGTTFQLDVDKMGTLLTVFEGLIEFKNKFGAILVEKAKQSRSLLEAGPLQTTDADLNGVKKPDTPDMNAKGDAKGRKVTVTVKDADGKIRTIELEYEK